MRYYKLGNVQEGSNFEVITEIKKVEKILKKNSVSILASFFSAFMANILANKCGNFADACFIVFFIAIYFAFVFLIYIFKKFKPYVFAVVFKNDINSDMEDEIYNLFYMKTLNDIVHAVSLKNRYFELKKLKEKEELRYIYLQQSFFYFEEVNQQFDVDILGRNSVQRKANIEKIGKQKIERVLYDAITNLRQIQDELKEEYGMQCTTCDLVECFEKKKDIVSHN